MIKSWPTLEWYLPYDDSPLESFQYLDSQTRDSPAANGRRQGETVWIGSVKGHSVGLAWEWAEHRPGVLVLADPNCIVSNVRFVDEEGVPVPPLLALIALNRVVHALPWQEAVSKAIGPAPDTAQTVIPVLVRPGLHSARPVLVDPQSTQLARHQAAFPAQPVRIAA
jgi:hypothetical protein